jgi:hypothetical protein
MRHLRKDYDAIQAWPTKRPHIAKRQEETVDYGEGLEEIESFPPPNPIIPNDEPVFLLRARDTVAPEIVRYWADMVQSKGGEASLCDRVRDWADEMEQYGRDHGNKVPDTPSEYLR